MTAIDPAPAPAAVPAAGPKGRHDIDWRHAVDQVRWVPAEHRLATVPWATATRILRCTEASFAQLLDLGLPREEGPDGVRFDVNDLKNVALYSGSGVTEVERAMQFVLGYMQASREELTRPKRWKFTLKLESVAEDAADRRVYRPTPEAFGGEVDAGDWTDDLPDPVAFRLRPGTPRVGVLTTRGRDQPIRSAEIRRIAEDLTAGGIRWHYLPKAVEDEPDEVTARGAGNCATLSHVLQRELAAAGFEAQAFHGWIVGSAEIDHGWVEVTDEDGQRKCLDPSFSVLAAHNGFGSPDFCDFVNGSTLNRVIPTRAPLHDPFVLDGDITATVRFSCRPADA